MRTLVRSAVAGVMICVFACGVSSLVFATLLSRLDAAEAAATATATGRVVDDGIGPAEDVRVRWTDADGVRREQRFGVYDTDRYVTGADFEVQYDPDDVDARAVPADPEETVAADDLTAGLVGPWLVPVALVAWWGVRLTRARLALGRPTSRHVVEVRGTRSHRSSLGSVVAVVRFTEGREVLTQRVAWSRELDTLPATVEVDLTDGARRAVRLPSGTWLAPIGTADLATERHPTWPLAALRTTQSDAFVSTVPSRGSRLRTALSIGATTGAAGLVVGFGASGPLVAMVLAALLSTGIGSWWLASASAP